MGAPAPADLYVSVSYLISAAAVCRNATVRVARIGLAVAYRDLPITCFLSTFWGLAKLKKLNTEKRVYRT